MVAVVMRGVVAGQESGGCSLTPHGLHATLRPPVGQSCFRQWNVSVWERFELVTKGEGSETPSKVPLQRA